MSTKLGLKQRIQNASSNEEIKTLLAEGAGYTKAAPGTVRQWQRAADKRALELAAKGHHGSIAKQSRVSGSRVPGNDPAAR